MAGARFGNTPQAVARAAAERLLAHGLAVIPLRIDPRTGKHVPLSRGWPDGLGRDSGDVTRWPSSAVGVGVVCGAASGVFCVDVDQHSANGFETLAELGASRGALPGTLTVDTAGGGQHLYYRLPAGRAVGNRRDALGPGVDVWGDRHFCTAAGTRADGTAYRLAVDVPPSEPPAWLVEMLPAPGGIERPGVSLASAEIPPGDACPEVARWAARFSGVGDDREALLRWQLAGALLAGEGHPGVANVLGDSAIRETFAAARAAKTARDGVARDGAGEYDRGLAGALGAAPAPAPDAVDPCARTGRYLRRGWL